MNHIPELLAPAGSMEALKAAVNAGADAVYLAGKKFGARHYAANFNDKNIEEAVNYAHLRGVRVYVTVNTLIKDHELNKVARYLQFLDKIGVDAILVQDIGAAKLAKKVVPDLNLHTSTQMTIHNLEGVKWASEFGFKRVVLSREMELSQIEEIDEKSEGIEFEIFAHGALCYSYSGQCLLSSFIGGRSGNRGMCAQPCRRKYKIVWGEKDEYGRPSKLSTSSTNDKYILSTRDLSLYKYLPKIIGLNVRSLKIEGRMRSPEYVAIVVSTYRKALDSILKGKWKADKEDINKLKFAFNREFTGGYILDYKYSRLMGRDRPGNRGVYSGSVIEYNKKSRKVFVEIKGSVTPQKGDGLVFISNDHKNKEYGMVLNGNPEIRKNRIKFNVSTPLKKGTFLYITRSKDLMDKAQKIIDGTCDDLKNQIMVDLKILIQNDGAIILKSKFNGADGPLKLEMISDFKMEKAIKSPLDKETIKKQMTKTGGTPFKIQNMKIHYPENLFTPISKLNKLRRDLFKQIEKKIISSYLPFNHESLNSKKPPDETLKISSSKRGLKKVPQLGVYVNDLNSLKGAIDGGCRRIYFDPFIQNSIKCELGDLEIQKITETILKAKDICISSEADFILKLPKITHDRYLKDILKIVKQLSVINEFMVDGIGAAKALMNLDDSIKLYGSSGLNIWNHLSVKELSKQFKGLTISPELSKNEIKLLISNIEFYTSLELLVHGNIESIVSKDCIPCIRSIKEIKNNDTFLGLQDIKNRVFPVLIDSECHTYIFNSVELCLIDHLPFISKSGVNKIIIDARGRSEKYAYEISSIYMDALQITAKENLHIKKNLDLLKNKIKKISLGGITTGNFLKGVKE